MLKQRFSLDINWFYRQVHYKPITDRVLLTSLVADSSTKMADIGDDNKAASELNGKGKIMGVVRLIILKITNNFTSTYIYYHVFMFNAEFLFVLEVLISMAHFSSADRFMSGRLFCLLDLLSCYLDCYYS